MTRATKTSALAWNDPLLSACESAPCGDCGHDSLDHEWTGCEYCACGASGIHALLISGVVEVRRVFTTTADPERAALAEGSDA